MRVVRIKSRIKNAGPSPHIPFSGDSPWTGLFLTALFRLFGNFLQRAGEEILELHRAEVALLRLRTDTVPDSASLSPTTSI